MRISKRMRRYRRDKRRRIIRTSIITLTLIFIAVGVFVSNYYHTDDEAVDAFLPNLAVEAEELDDGTIVYAPEGATTGIIFYPGGKVEYTAYIPLMKALANEGIMTVLVDMPFNLAFLSISRADGIQEQFPEIESWYMAGHSLGGSMAASYVSGHTEDFDGLILLASYSTKDLSESDLSVLSVYGSADEVLDRDKYDDKLSNLPEGYTEVVIEGGNHAGFGMYGEQSGDGDAAISAAEQVLKTAKIIAEFVK